MASYLSTLVIGDYRGDPRRAPGPAGGDRGAAGPGRHRRRPGAGEHHGGRRFPGDGLRAVPVRVLRRHRDHDPRIGFALETQSRPVYSAGFFAGGDTSVVAHELAHQWFGDSVSGHRWQDIWLNEGLRHVRGVALDRGVGRTDGRGTFDRPVRPRPGGDLADAPGGSGGCGSVQRFGLPARWDDAARAAGDHRRRGVLPHPQDLAGGEARRQRAPPRSSWRRPSGSRVSRSTISSTPGCTARLSRICRNRVSRALSPAVERSSISGNLVVAHRLPVGNDAGYALRRGGHRVRLRRQRGGPAAGREGLLGRVLEAGRRFADDEFPETSWRVRRFLWAPALGCYGIQRHRPAARPTASPARACWCSPAPGSAAARWSTPTPSTSRCRRSTPIRSGATSPTGAPSSRRTTTRPSGCSGVDLRHRDPAPTVAISAVADRMGVGAHLPLHPGRGALRRGPASAAPTRTSAGPARSAPAAPHCGACMTGCRIGAKNTLVKNYLCLAERLGAQVHPLTTVTAVRPGPRRRVRIDTARTGGRRAHAAPGRSTPTRWSSPPARSARSGCCTGCGPTGRCPRLSARLGRSPGPTPSRSSARGAARRGPRPGLDYTDGVAITSSFHPDPQTHIEPVRYGKRLQRRWACCRPLLTDGGPRRVRRWLGRSSGTRSRARGCCSVRGWSQRTMIALVMQSVDNSLDHPPAGGAGSAGGLRHQRRGTARPTRPGSRPATRRSGCSPRRSAGSPGGAVTELFNIPVTAHILGGAAIGATPADGVIDAYHRVYGHAGLHVVDGAAVSANLGVNPSLTITAQAERAMSFWPNKGEPDPRPPLGSAVPAGSSRCRRSNPAVPQHAPAALRPSPCRRRGGISDACRAAAVVTARRRRGRGAD